MRKIVVLLYDQPAGELEEFDRGKKYIFRYLRDYKGAPVSLALPVQESEYHFESFPPFLDGLLPEGVMLESLLRQSKIDKDDLLSQLIAVGSDLVGAITVKEMP